MKNADLPAMPIEINGFGQFAPEAHTGLSKREHFAAMAMQGLLVNAERNGLTFDNVHAQAVKCADALLAELERTK